MQKPLFKINFESLIYHDNLYTIRKNKKTNLLI